LEISFRYTLYYNIIHYKDTYNTALLLLSNVTDKFKEGINKFKFFN